jgi:hypothetical protein
MRAKKGEVSFRAYARGAIEPGKTASTAFNFSSVMQRGMLFKQ